MIIELGNHSNIHEGIDDRPKITTISIPEYDDGSNHPDAVYEGGRHPCADEFEDDGVTMAAVGKLVTPGAPRGGYTHEIGGISVSDFKAHVYDSIASNNGLTRLPDHEILLSVCHPAGAWRKHGRGRPAWVKVADPSVGGTGMLAIPDGRAQDIEKFLSEFYGCPGASDFFGTADEEEQLVKKELGYWTRTPPGELPPGLSLPDVKMMLTDDGRVIANMNDGGGSASPSSASGFFSGGTISATSTTIVRSAGSFTSASAIAPSRVWIVDPTSATAYFANVLSFTTTTLTIDGWYSDSGNAIGHPTFGSDVVILLFSDSGYVNASWVALATGANAPVHSDHTLATNGNAEITTAGGGLIRKRAPYAQTSGVASRALTLTPVYTANGTDSLPAVVTTIGVFVSGYVGAVGTMKYETALSNSATLAAVSDQLTVTETITGS